MKIFQRNIHYANFPVEITVLLHSQRGFFGYLFIFLTDVFPSNTSFTRYLLHIAAILAFDRTGFDALVQAFFGKGCCAKTGIIICSRKHNPICTLLSVGLSVTDNARKYAILAP